jgi:serine/threonine protein kinase
LAKKGEAFEYIHQAGGLPLPLVRFYFLQLLDAVDYMHAQGICHRDLKWSNILLNSNLELKVADFGLHKIFEGEGADILTTNCGTSFYRAPEMTLNKGYEGPPVDIYAMGPMLFILAYGIKPYTAQKDELHAMLHSTPDQYVEIMKNKYAQNVDVDLIDLFRKMTNKDPKKRLTSSEIREQAFLKDKEVATVEDLATHY